MQDPKQPSLPKPPSVAGVDSDVIAGLAVQLIGERLKQIFALLVEPTTFKPHQRHGRPTE